MEHQIGQYLNIPFLFLIIRFPCSDNLIVDFDYSIFVSDYSIVDFDYLISVFDYLIVNFESNINMAVSSATAKSPNLNYCQYFQIYGMSLVPMLIRYPLPYQTHFNSDCQEWMHKNRIIESNNQN